MNAARAGLLYGLAVFGCGFGFGVVRTLWLAPQVGALVAVAIEVPLLLIVAWWLCRRLIARSAVGPARGDRVAMAAAALAFTAAAEITGARMLGGLSVGAWLAGLATPAGLVGLAGQLLFAAFPLLQRRRAASGAARCIDTPPGAG